MNKIILKYLFVVLTFTLVASCTKEKDPVVKNDHVEVFADHAVFHWEVEYAEQASSVVELGTSSDMHDARRYGSEIPTGDKVFTVTVPQLNAGTTYYYRYLVLVSDKTFTMDLDHFTTSNVILPSVETLDVTDITGESAVLSGIILDDFGINVMEYGFCWASHDMPDMNDSVAVCRTGTDVFSTRIQGLQPSTDYYVRAFAKNVNGVAYGESKSFQTGILLTAPVVNTLNAHLLTPNSVSCDIEVVSDGGSDVVERGVCYGTNDQQLTVNNEHLAAETIGIGEFSIVVENLGTGKTYFFRAYAINDKGVGYGEILSVTTNDGLPVVNTVSVSEITTNSALCTGEVVDQGISSLREHGFCWSFSENPTIDDFHVKSIVTNVGVYNCLIDNLSDATEYHLRAYCRNHHGIAYGEDIVFTTLPIMPEVATLEVTDITAHSARCGGRVITDGSYLQTERGICWSTNPNPTTDGSHAIDPTLASGGSEVNMFKLDMTGLAANTVYYVRAYVNTAAGTTYGEEKTFTTRNE